MREFMDNAMKDIWAPFGKRLDDVKARDAKYSLVKGAQSHKYKRYPTIEDHVVAEYESQHRIQLPEDYRLYLQHFSNGGVGPNRGLYQFPKDVWQRNPASPFPIEYEHGIVHLDEKIKPLTELDGLIRIAQQMYLIVNGPWVGYVLFYDLQNMYCFCGPFVRWFKQWLDCVETGLNELEILNALPLGISKADILQRDGLTFLESNNQTTLYLKFSKSVMTFSEKNELIEISTDSNSVAWVGYMIWSEKEQLFTDAVA